MRVTKNRQLYIDLLNSNIHAKPTSHSACGFAQRKTLKRIKLQSRSQMAKKSIRNNCMTQFIFNSNRESQYCTKKTYKPQKIKFFVLPRQVSKNKPKQFYERPPFYFLNIEYDRSKQPKSPHICFEQLKKVSLKSVHPFSLKT